MPVNLKLPSAMLAFALALLGGCHAPPSARAKSRHPAAVTSSKVSPADSTSESALLERSRAHAHFAAGVIHDMNSENVAAKENYTQAALRDPGNEDLVLDVSRRLIQARDFENALAVVSRSAKRPDANAAVFARLGLVLAQLGRTEESTLANHTAISRGPRLLAGYQNLFVSSVQARDEESAWDFLQLASRVEDAPPDFLLGLSELYNAIGTQFPTRREPAKTERLRLLNLAAASPSLNSAHLLMLAENLHQAGESDKAAQLYSQLLKSPTAMPGLRERLHARLSEIYLKAEDREKAAEQLRALVKEDPTNAQAHYFLGALAMDARDPAEAIEHLERALLLNAEFEQAYYDLANAQISAQKAADALATLDKAATKFQPNFVREFLAGVALTHQKAYKEALARFTAAEVIARVSDPKRLTHFFYFQMGAAYERNGQIKEAEQAFEKCLELQPDFSGALNYLGYMWAERGENLERAQQLIEKALKAEPKSAAYLDSLGWVLFKRGKRAEALEQMRKAIELSEEPDATLYDHLGQIEASLGNTEPAREAFEKSLKLEDSAEVRKHLEALPK